jgi:hypothetical protein
MKLLKKYFRLRNASAAAMALLLSAAAFCPGQTSNQPPRVEYSAFKLITERNIFNPRRYARSARRAEPASRVDSFTLVGTMSYEKGPFAFFEGTRADYRKVGKVSDAIAGYKITNIAYNSVKLANGTNELQLAVGMQMRREDNGPWHVGSGGRAGNMVASTTETNSAPSTASLPDSETNSDQAQNATTSDAAGSSATTDDPVLKRLMQRREQENNR